MFGPMSVLVVELAAEATPGQVAHLLAGLVVSSTTRGFTTTPLWLAHIPLR